MRRSSRFGIPVVVDGTPSMLSVQNRVWPRPHTRVLLPRGRELLPHPENVPVVLDERANLISREVRDGSVVVHVEVLEYHVRESDAQDRAPWQCRPRKVLPTGYPGLVGPEAARTAVELDVGLLSPEDVEARSPVRDARCVKEVCALSAANHRLLSAAVFPAVAVGALVVLKEVRGPGVLLCHIWEEPRRVHMGRQRQCVVHGQRRHVGQHATLLDGLISLCQRGSPGRRPVARGYEPAIAWRA
eukprot:scaffold1790_cov257-Pinguiococcus_pyrenoidosus.AAC.6